MTISVAFVGAGPTTIYTLHALLAHTTRSFAITIFEEQPVAGRGTPYRPGWNDAAMLSNIASIEIPVLEEKLADWLRALPKKRLIALGVDPEQIGERTFYPRLALGEYFYDQFQALLRRAKLQGIDVTVRTRCRVLDALSKPNGMVLKVQPEIGDVFEERFNHVVLATGHQWPPDPEVKPGYFLSPWPASALEKTDPLKVGIRGSSLTAIDASVALAIAHGEFIERGVGQIDYKPAPNTDTFHMTMMSRKGLLPEADFYGPIPYEPLTIFTEEAVQDLLDASAGSLLDAAFALFKRELIATDPEYSAKIGLDALSIEKFYDRYFADRVDSDPFEWAEKNLKEAEQNYKDKFTVPWRYAILRMHEVMALLIPHLERHDFERFTRFFKPIFIDDYATVPHESIKRMLALHRASKLDIVAIGDDYRIDSHSAKCGADLLINGDRQHFPIFVEATGQKPLPAKDFPFPSLLRQGIVRDAGSPNDTTSLRGIIIDDQFHPVSDDIPEDQLFCLSLPFILGRHPFIQGITSSHEMGLIVGSQLAAVINRGSKTASQTNNVEDAA